MIRQAQDKDEAAIAGFLAQHIELVAEEEKHPIYTKRGFEIALEEGFSSTELLEICAWFCVMLFGTLFTPFGSFKSRKQDLFRPANVIFCLLATVGISTKTECKMVQEVVYDRAEHVIWTSTIFAISFVLPLSCQD